jgi:hypothetical protein
VNDYTSELSMYITLVAVGCSAVLILVILLITSICCCYCCARRKQLGAELSRKVASGGGVPLDQSLVIQNFPALPKGQKLAYDFSDESTKSSQQHILNGSAEVYTVLYFHNFILFYFVFFTFTLFFLVSLIYWVLIICLIDFLVGINL